MRHAKHVFSVIAQMGSLTLRETADIDSPIAIDTHPLERFGIGHRGYDQLPRILERYEPFVEQMIHRRREEETVLSVQPLLVAAVPPRADMARDEVLHSIHPGYPARVLDASHLFPKESLPSPRLH